MFWLSKHFFSLIYVAAGLSPRPPMGWRTWNAFYCDIDQSKVLQTAKKIVGLSIFGGSGKKSLRDLGFTDVGLDDCWQECGK